MHEDPSAETESIPQSEEKAPSLPVKESVEDMALRHERDREELVAQLHEENLESDDPQAEERIVALAEKHLLETEFGRTFSSLEEATEWQTQQLAESNNVDVSPSFEPTTASDSPAVPDQERNEVPYQSATQPPPPEISEVSTIINEASVEKEASIDPEKREESFAQEVVPQKKNEGELMIPPEILASINTLSERKAAILALQGNQDPEQRKELGKLRRNIFEEERNFFARLPDDLRNLVSPRASQVILKYKNLFQSGGRANWHTPKEGTNLSAEEIQDYKNARLQKAAFIGRLAKQGLERESAKILFHDVTNQGLRAQSLIARLEKKDFAILEKASAREVLKWFDIPRNRGPEFIKKELENRLAGLPALAGWVKEESVQDKKIETPEQETSNINASAFVDQVLEAPEPAITEEKGDQTLLPEIVQEEENRNEETAETVSVESTPEAPTTEESGALAVLATEQLREEVTAEVAEQAKEKSFANFDKSSATDVEFRPVGDDESKSTEVLKITPGTKEKTSEQLSARIVEGFTKQFNIPREELGKIEGFGQLSEGQQLLVLERMKSTAFEDINSEKVSRYRARIDELSKSDHFWDKVKGMGIRWSKQFQLGRMKDEVSQEWLKATDVDAMTMKRDALEGLVAQALQTKEFRVVEGEGKLYTAFISPKDFEGPIDAATEAKIFELNRVANLYANKAFAEDDEAGKIQLKQQYEGAARAMSRLLAEQTGGKWSGDNAAEWRTKLEGAVQMSRFFQDNPEVDKELQKSGKNLGAALGFKNFLAERGSYSLLSGGARYLGVATVGLVAAPVVAAIGGGVMGWRRTKQELSENDLLAAMGEKDKSDDKEHGKTGSNEKDRAKNIVSGEKLSSKLEDLLKAYEGASETTMVKVSLRDVQGDLRFRDIPNAEGKIATEQISEKEALRRQLEARVAYTTRKMEEQAVDLGSVRGDRAERIAALAQTLGKAQATLGFADEGPNAIEMRMDHILDIREEKIEANRKSHLIKQAAKGAAMGAGFSAAGMLVGSFLPGHARAGGLHDSLAGKSKSLPLGTKAPGDVIQGGKGSGNLHENITGLQHAGGARGLREYAEAHTPTEKAAIAKEMGIGTEEADARAQELLRGGGISPKTSEVDVTSEVKPTNINDAAARRVLSEMDKMLKPEGGSEEALAEAHNKALLYEAYAANPTKHIEIAQEIGLSPQEIEAKIQSILEKTPASSMSGEALIGAHTVVQGENLTHILLEKSPGIHMIKELGGENGRHEAERTIQNLIRHLEKLSPEELKKIIPSGNVNLIRPGDQINLDALEASIGKVSPVDVSHVGAEVIGDGGGGRVTAEVASVTPVTAPVEHYDDSVIKSSMPDQEGGQFIKSEMKVEVPSPQPGTREFAEKMSGLWAKSAHEGIYKNPHWGEVRNLSIKEIFTGQGPNHDPSLLQDGSTHAARLQMENLVDKAHMMGFQATSGDEKAGAFLDRVAKELGEPLTPTRAAERSTALWKIAEKNFTYMQRNEATNGLFVPTAAERIWENTGIAPSRGEPTEAYAERAIAQMLEKRPTLHVETLLKRDMTFAGKPIIEGSTPSQVAAQQIFFKVPAKELMDPNYHIPDGMSENEVAKLRMRIGQVEQMRMVPGDRESAGDFLRRSLRELGRGGSHTETSPNSPPEYANGTRVMSNGYPEKPQGNPVYQQEPVRSVRSGGEHPHIAETIPVEHASVSDSKLEMLSTRHENNLARLDMQETQRVDAIKANYQNRMEQIAMNKEQQAMNRNMGSVQRGVGQLPNILNGRGAGGLGQVIQQEVTGRVQGSAMDNLQESQSIRQAQMDYERDMRTTQSTFEQMRANETMNYEIQTKEIEQQAIQQNQRQQGGTRFSR